MKSGRATKANRPTRSAAAQPEGSVWSATRAMIAAAAMAAFLILAGGCEDDPFGDVPPRVREGGARIWELSAAEFPSAFDLFTGRRLFLGSGEIDANLGDFFLGGPPGSTELRLRSISSLVAAEATHAVEIQDLGAVSFTDLMEAPREGYVSAEDSIGVAVIEGHVYALRVRRSSLDPNYAKVVVEAMGSTADDPDLQFIDFRYAIQTQPGNRRFESED